MTDGKQIGTCAIESTGGWGNWASNTCKIKKVSGKHNLYVVIKGNSDESFRLNWWQFEPVIEN